MSLADQVQGMFSELMGYDDLDVQLSIWCHGEAARRTTVAREWRDRNAERFASAVREWQQANRDKVRAADAKWRASLPPESCWCKQPRAPGKSLCQTHLDKNRDYARARAAQRKAA